MLRGLMEGRLEKEFTYEMNGTGRGRLGRHLLTLLVMSFKLNKGRYVRITARIIRP